MRLFFLTIPKPLKQYTLFKKRLSIPLSDPEVNTCVLRMFTERAFSCNDIGRVALSFQLLSGGGDRGSRVLFTGERLRGQECHRC
jgi:hypothetical protein